MIGFINTKSSGWVRTDIIVNVYVESVGSHYCVKLRTSPGVFAWHPVYSQHATTEEAESMAGQLAGMLARG